MSALSCQEGMHHCAIFPGDDHGGAAHRSFQECTLNPGHEKFLIVEEFMNSQFSESFGDHSVDTKAFFLNYIDRTVRVLTSYTSESRPDTYLYSKTPYPFKDYRGSNMWMRCGTGFLDKVSSSSSVVDISKSCPCLDCKMPKGQTPKLVECSYYFEVVTAAHIVFDKCEAQWAVFEFFYDVEPRGEKVAFLYGVDILEDEFNKLVTDRCCVLCVTHDACLAEKLQELCIPYRNLGCLNNPTGILISHPHGACKRISIGEFNHVRCIAQTCTASIKLKKGRKIRFSGCQDMTDIVKQINDQLMDDKPVIGYVESDETKTIRLLCDVTLCHHSNIAVECELKSRFESLFYDFNNSWWRLPPGIDLVTENGKCFTLLHNPADANTISVSMEIFIKSIDSEASSLRRYIRNKFFGLSTPAKYFTYITYDMASCPGSSGGLVFENMTPKCSMVQTTHHFGCMGQYNRSVMMDNDVKWPHYLPLTDGHRR